MRCALNRVIEKDDPIPGQHQFVTYDNNSNLLSVIDENGKTESYQYDALNRRIRTTDHLGNSTQEAFDAVGDETGETDENGHGTVKTYDRLNRLTRETFVDGTMREYSYDEVGNVASRKDNNGNTTTYVYDNLYRLTARLYPGGNNDHFTYDPAGQLVSASNNDAAITYAYDSDGRILSETLNGNTTAYSYDIAGRKRTITYPGGRPIGEYRDQRERLTTIKDGGSTLATYIYDGADRDTSLSHANGVVAHYEYNHDDWLVRVRHTQGTTLIAGFEYAFDGNGNTLSEKQLHDAGRSQAYVYDAAYRLTGFRRGALVGDSIPAPTTRTQYNYDPAGNRVTVVENASATSYTTNNMNEYTTVTDSSSYPLAYDGNGNLLTDAVHTYQYDYENRLISVDGGTTARYYYDPFGRRIQKITPQFASHFYYDGSRVIEERDGLGNLVIEYTYGVGIDELLRMTSGGVDYFYHPNALGSIVAISDALGSIVERYEYDAYGHPTIRDPSYAVIASSLERIS